MAILSNINGKFAVESSGAIQLSGSAGTSGYVLKSNGTGNAASWVDPTTIIGGPYLPLSGGTLTGATATASGISFTVGGTFTVTGKFQTTSTGAQVTGSTFTVYHPSSATKLQFIQTNGNWKIEAGGGTNKLVFHSESLVEDYLTIKGGGQIQLNDYGSGSHTGTTAYTLAVDSSGNIIETTDGGGDITGSGTTNTVAKFTGAKAIGNGPVTFSGNDSTFAGDVRVSGGVTRIISNQIQAGYNQNVDNTDIWINYTGYQGGSTYFRDFRVGNGKTGQIAVFKGVSSSVGIGHNSPNSKLSIVGPGADNAYSGVIGIENSSSAKWGYITFTDDIDTISSSSNYYLIGRGQSYTDRHFSFHIPRASDYGSGSEPKFIFASTGADQLFTIEAGTGNAYHKGNVGIGTTLPSHNLEISGVGGDGTPLLQFTGSASATYNWISSAMHANLASGETSIHLFGQAESSKNSGYIGYLYSSSGSDNNAVTIGHFAANHLVNILANGNVGIGATDPVKKLDVRGQLAISNSASSYWYLDRNDSTGNFEILTDTNSSVFNIDTSGNVAIGTTSLTEKLRVQGNSGSDLLVRFQPFTNNAQTKLYLSSVSSGDGGYFYDANNNQSGLFAYGDYTFYVGTSNISGSIGDPRMIIKQGGNVGIGTTNPNQEGFGSANRALSVKALSSGGVANLELIGLGNADNDELGYVNFMSQSATNSAAAIVGLRHTSDTSGKLSFRTAGSERMRIDNNGNLSLSDGSVTLNKSDGTYIVFNYNNSTKGYVGSERQILSGGLEANMAIGALGDFAIGTGSSLTERMRVKSGGYIGMNTSPSGFATLEIENIASTTYGLYVDYIDTNGSYGAMKVILTGASTSPSYVDWWYGATQTGAVVTTGSSTQYLTSSDYRLKENIVPMSNAVDRVKQLKPSRFNFIGHENTVDGLIAHEVAEVVPEAVNGEKDGLRDDGTPKYQGIDEGKLVPLLIGAIQELEARVKELENK